MSPTSLAGRDLALLIGMNLIWGLNLIASKIGVGQFPPIFFTALRFGSLALFLVPMLKIHRGQMTNLFAAAMLTGPAGVCACCSPASFSRRTLPRSRLRRRWACRSRR